MLPRLRRLFVIVIALCVLLTGIVGWSGSAAALARYQHLQATYHQFADDGPDRITCPPPPYIC